jgi:Cu/Ag efflux protein CusF
MKKLIMTASLIALPLGLSACDKPAETPKAEAQADAMGEMAMSTEAKMAKGSGTVTAIDTATGKITLDHGPIASLEWPAMKMGFDAKPELLASVAVGDKVEFDVTVTGSASEVTAIRKQ